MMYRILIVEDDPSIAGGLFCDAVQERCGSL